MFRKNDILPSILAFISTAIVVALGLLWFSRIDGKNASKLRTRNSSQPSQGSSNSTSAPKSSSLTFHAPSIVPQGTSIRINGSTRMIPVNQALKKSFQRQFPGTSIVANADGSETGLELLRTGDIDLAAIFRPLTTEEKAQGYVAVAVDELVSNGDNKATQEVFYYVYQEPVSTEVEIFLGFALSRKGQQAIINR